MLKTLSLVAGAFGALAMSCASNHSEPQVASQAGCQKLGDTSQVVATQLAPEVVYGADRVAAERPVSVTGTQPGTALYLHAAPGMSQEYLERVLSCHAAYGRQLNGVDPFHPESGRVTSVSVSSAGSGYQVRVVGQDSRTDDEIWHRARELAYSTVQTEQVASASSSATKTQ